MPVPGHKHQLSSRAWVGLDHVEKDLREHFCRNKVGFMTRQQLMDLVTSQQVMAFVNSSQDKGGCTIEGQGKVA